MALFTPFRALGYITSDVAPSVQRRGAETFITVSIGKSWQVYNANTLRLAWLGPQLRNSITCIASKGDFTFSAVRNTVVECRRVHVTGEYIGHDAAIIQIMVLGDVLLTLGKDQRLLAWRIGKYDTPLREMQLSQGFVPTFMVHPETYLNKLVIGSEDGRMQLWNFSTGKLIHEFGSFGSGIRCMTASPALDVIGIGLSDGRAIVHNLKFDEKIAEFFNAAGAGMDTEMYLKGSATRAAKQSLGVSCTALAFRTSAGIPILAAGGDAGVITVWNLEERKLHTTVRDAHDGPVSSLHFFKGEPVMMSSGADNSLKEWIFDGPDGNCRLLRFRSGHAAPPTRVRHYGPDGRWLLSAGQDRAFRCFSTIQDAQSRELSQKHTKRRAKRLRISEIEIKLDRIVALDACDVRERDWSNVLTAHHGDTNAYVWRLQNFALGEHILSPPPKECYHDPPLAPITSVALSRCGNFGFVGSANGRIDRYNMQSGLHRGTYRREVSRDRITGTANGSEQSPSFSNKCLAHDGPVTGLSCDASNRYAISAGLDAVVRVWDFSKRFLKGEINVFSPVNTMAHHANTGLVAVSCDDLVIRMVDVETKQLVRHFRGHIDRITDMQFSSDCKWLISSAMDNTLRIWDVPGAQVLQVLRLGSPVTSLSLSPSQDLLATTHVEHDGVYLWANQLIFGSGADIIPSKKPINARLPSLNDGISGLDDALTIPNQNKQTGKDAEEMLKYSLSAKLGSHDHKRKQLLDFGHLQEDLEHKEVEQYVSSSDDVSSLLSECSDQDLEMEDSKATDFSAGRYALTDSAGAPVPLLPELATLSMLPRTQWLNLVHLDTIKIRNKPIEAPKKPEAAPFFLPTLAGENAGRNPVFDTSALEKETAKKDPMAAAAMAAWGDGEDEISHESSSDAGESDRRKTSQQITSRVMNSKIAEEKFLKANTNRFVQLLRESSHAGDWTSLLSYLRNSSPIEVDRELRSMEILDIDNDQDAQDLETWLQFLETEAASQSNFEFLQALLKATLAIHGEAIMLRQSLRSAAARIESRMSMSWQKLGNKLTQARCVLALLGSLQN